MILYGKMANSYNIDINKYLKFIKLKDRLDIKRKHNISLDDSDYSLLTEQNYNLLTKSEINEILFYTFKNQKNTPTDLSKYIDLIPIEEQINFKKLYAVELSDFDQYYIRHKEEEKNKKTESQELNNINQEKILIENEQEKWDIIQEGCLRIFLILLVASCLLIKFFI